jgi:hypothetical protein
MNTRFSGRSIAAVGLGLFSIVMGGCAAAHTPPTFPTSVRVVAPPPTERVLLDEHFSTYSPYYREVRGHWGVVGGRLMQTRDEARELNTVRYYAPLTIADAEITTEATMMSDLPQFTTSDDDELLKTRRRIGGAGLVFRFQDENNFYLFRMAGEDGVVLGKVVNGQWQELANPRAEDFSGVRLRTDVPYELRVRVVGRRIQCWIADRAVANLEDGSFTTGRVGLSTFRSKAAFNSLKIVER